MKQFRVRQAAPDSCDRVIRFLFARDESDPCVSVNFAGPLFVAEALPEKRIVGAARATLSAFVDSAHVACMEFRVDRCAPTGVAVDLLSHVERFCRTNNAELIQSVLSIDDSISVEALKSIGFEACETQGRLLPLVNSQIVESTDLKFISIAAAEDRRLRKIIAQTFIGTQDCPALERSGWRIREVGSRLLARNHTARFVVMFERVAIGFALLEHVEKNSEIVYFGVVADSRGNGFGRDIVGFAINWAVDKGSQWLIANVDAANLPATRIYDEFGFMIFDRRIVLLKSTATDIFDEALTNSGG